MWYIHTKGVTAPNNPNQRDWRKYMEYFTIERYEDCIKALETYDVCGVNWHPPLWDVKNYHFSGNFWWARAEYIKNLPPINLDGDRHEAESFLGYGNPRVKCLHESDIDHYRYPCPRVKYHHG